jgi:hypothetical protein
VPSHTRIVAPSAPARAAAETAAWIVEKPPPDEHTVNVAGVCAAAAPTEKRPTPTATAAIRQMPRIDRLSR